MVVFGPGVAGRMGSNFVIEAEQGTLHKTLRLLLGWDEEQPLPFVRERSAVQKDNLNAAIAENPTRQMHEHLFRQGYLHQRRFALLPSRRNLRWLLPHVARRRGIDGLQLYMPYGNAARILKALVVQARATGWQGWVRDSLVIASREALPIETLLTNLTGEKELFLSLSPGTPGAAQKLTVQVMRPEGSILGYVKMPMTEAAGDRLRHEAAIVRDLHSYPELRSHIPRLLFAGLLQGRYVVFQSALEGNMGPRRFTPLHETFLERLHRCRFEQRPGERIVEETGRKWSRIAGRMGTKWQELGRAALRIAARELDGCEIACGIGHGDFAPWNTRVNEGALRLFDWESASWNAPLLWDQFHFMTQTECLLKIHHKREPVADERRKNRSLYLLYLLNTVGQFWEEEAKDVVIRYREEQLVRFLSSDYRAA